MTLYDHTNAIPTPLFVPIKKPAGKVQVSLMEIEIFPEQQSHSQWPKRQIPVNLYIHWSIGNWQQRILRSYAEESIEADSVRAAIDYLPDWLKKLITPKTPVNLTRVDIPWAMIVLNGGSK